MPPLRHFDDIMVVFDLNFKVTYVTTEGDDLDIFTIAVANGYHLRNGELAP